MDFYNHTRALFAAGDVNEANLKVMLVSGYTFPSSQTAGDGTPFNVTWDAAGIATWSAV